MRDFSMQNSLKSSPLCHFDTGNGTPGCTLPKGTSVGRSHNKIAFNLRRWRDVLESPRKLALGNYRKGYSSELVERHNCNEILDS